MKHLFPFFALFAFVFVSCETQQTPVEPQNSSTAFEKAEHVRDAPVTGFFYNECCDEVVQVDAIAHMIFRNNGMHMTIKDLVGVGLTSGSTYTGHNTAIQNIKENSGNGASNFSAVVTTHLTNEDGCGFKLKIHVHTTTDANGVVRVVVDSYEIDCD